MVDYSPYLSDYMQEKLHMTIHPGIDPPSFETSIRGFEDNNAILESTYFYPRGGGQPGDMGILSTENSQSTIN